YEELLERSEQDGDADLEGHTEPQVDDVGRVDVEAEALWSEVPGPPDQPHHTQGADELAAERGQQDDVGGSIGQRGDGAGDERADERTEHDQNEIDQCPPGSHGG